MKPTQVQNKTFEDFLVRTDILAEKIGCTVKELSSVLGVSPNTILGGRTGRLPISNKTWIRLEQAEVSNSLKTLHPKELQLNEPAAVYKAAGNAAGDKPKIQADRLKINTAFRTAPAEPTAEDCISYLAAYVSRARLVPGMIGHTWIQLKRHFPIEDLEQLDDSGPKQLG